MRACTFASARRRLQELARRFEAACVDGWYFEDAPYCALGPTKILLDRADSALTARDHFGYDALGVHRLLSAVESTLLAEHARHARLTAARHGRPLEGMHPTTP